LTQKTQHSHFRIEPLDACHDRAAFSCGIEELDRYLRKQAGQDLKKRVAAVFVATADGSTAAGFYTLSAHMLHVGELPAAVAKKLPRYPNVPVTLLGRLAVSKEFQGQGLGELLLMDALRQSLLGSQLVASAAVVVDSKNDEARRFYEKYDFIPLPSNPTRLFYPMKTIAALFPSDAPLPLDKPKS
jgi:ribosomal protein S18 acetylase RimI-like enzyme